MRILVTLAFVSAFTPTVLLAQTRMKMAVLPTQFDESAKGQVPSLFDDYLLTAVQNYAVEYEVIGQEDITAMLGFEQQKDLLACEDTSCMADIGGALGVHKLLVVKIARLAEDWVMTAKIINIKATTVEARVNHMAGGDVKGLLNEVSTLVTKVFGGRQPPVAAAPMPAAEPSPATPAPPAPQPAEIPAPEESIQADTGWAMSAGVLGSISSGLTLILTFATAATTDSQITSISLGATAIVLTAVMTPVSFAGASSARDHPAVNGSLALRILGWVSYGLAMLDGIVLLSLGIIDVEVPWEAIASAGVLGATSTACMAIDAFISYAQASSVAAEASGGDSVSLFPWWTVRVDPTRATAAPLVGMGLTF